MLRKKPNFYIKPILLVGIISSSFLSSTCIAKTIYIPIKRSIKSQPITKLEVVATVKAKHKGRILSVKKHSSYLNPDCFHVKVLEDRGEFQLIKVGCRKKPRKK